MMEEVMIDLHAEPQVAFFDKEDGYFYHKQIIHNARTFLKEGGILYLEFDITQRDEIENIVINEGFKTYSFLSDPYHHEFVIKIVKETLTA
jgi:methylase of polypeptide subunit release factors